MHYLFFLIPFLYLVNRLWILAFLSSLRGTKLKGYDLKDPTLIEKIYKKTGVRLTKIKILETDKAWGMMGGLPGFPYMVVAKDAYEDFSPGELEWLLYHEAGHYAASHAVKQIILQIFFVVVGVEILTAFNSNIIACIFSLSFASIYTQIVRRFEYEANTFSLERMDHPEVIGSIHARAKTRWLKKVDTNEDSLLSKLFNVWLFRIYEDLLSESKKLLPKQKGL